MEQTLAALTGILLKAVPTIIFVIFLHFYIKAMLFKPLEKVLAERAEKTSGARERAQQALALAEKKTAEYEAALRAARAEAFKEQEAARKQWLAEQTAQVQTARERSDAQIAAARETFATESATARQGLIETSAQLAEQIATAVLGAKRV
ncbi:MAG: hypothetical protein ABI823_00405 [Bryobacteraceae bacterium]